MTRQNQADARRTHALCCVLVSFSSSYRDTKDDGVPIHSISSRRTCIENSWPSSKRPRRRSLASFELKSMQFICVRIADFSLRDVKVETSVLCSRRSRIKQSLAFLSSPSFNLFSIVDITRVLSLVCVYKYFSCVCVCVCLRVAFSFSFFGNTKNKKERETCFQLQTNVPFQHVQRTFDHFILKQKKSLGKVVLHCWRGT